METDTKHRYVSWYIFTWVIGLLIMGIGWTFAVQATTNAKLDKYNTQLLEIRTQLSQIQTDIQWIKTEQK